MRVKITVCGVVQGVGFRPFVAGLAEELHIQGSVRNSGGIVTIDAYGNEEAMDKFICRLRGISENSAHGLPAGHVERLITENMPEGVCIPDGFSIIESEENNFADSPLIPVDLPTCDVCLEEMKNQENPRFRYPFISCVNCGPRYSILESLPYDRDRITMLDFEMCPDCAEEYGERGNRRRHAQTISCKKCGPQLLFLAKGDVGGVNKVPASGEEALERAELCLKDGGILALKGIGGYQLVCRPDRTVSILRLREMKGREKKPFAVMFSSIEEIKGRCEVSDAEENLLKSTARPIVLLKPKERYGGFAGELCSESRFLGAFLAYTGLHQILTEECGPLIVTSANLSDDPIMTGDAQLQEWMEKTAVVPDAVVWNRRRIVTPLDDSVVRVTGGKTQILRRSRGMVPKPITADFEWKKPVMAFGGDLKSVFGFAAGKRFYPSQYLGDLENYRVGRQFEMEKKRMQELLGIEPQILVCDMHPGYISSDCAKTTAEELGIPLIQVQHHHAHAASVMAEHGLEHCLAFVFDGTGYGTDGHVWGGEFLLCRGKDFERAGHLDEVQLCGGDLSAKDAQLAAVCHLLQAGVRETEAKELLEKDSWKLRYDMAQKAVRWNINTEYSSSMGRFFDAVSALLGIWMENTYEGECASALENMAAKAMEYQEEPIIYPLTLTEKEGILIADRSELIRQLAQYAPMWENSICRRLALGFHESIACMVRDVSLRMREKCGETDVVLGGGVFANVILQERCRELLEESGFSVYVNEQMPGNDGGICLGQAWLAQSE